MRVLYLTLGLFDKGGIARYGRYQVSALRAALGHDNVEVLSLLGPEKGGFESPFSVQWHGSESRRYRRTRMAIRGLRSSAIRPDIIWSGHVNLSPMGLVLARLSGAHPVLNVYGLEVWSKKRIDVDIGLRHTPFIVSDCNFTANFLNAEMPSSFRKTFVAWDCVDCDRFNPGVCRDSVMTKYGLSPLDGRFKVLTLGRISHYSRHKGWERLVAVASKLKGKRIVFIVAGDGDFREELQDLVHRCQLGESFVFTGSIGEEDLVDLYRYSDLFSLVSDRGEGRGEGLPLTPLEAAACGKAIIVGNQDGSQEAVEDALSGYAIDPFDLERHANLIYTLSQDRGLTTEIGESARKRVLQNFSYDRFKDTTASIVQSIAQLG